MRHVILFALALALATACGPASGRSAPACTAGRTPLDGTCVSERVADYVSCVRAQGAQLGSAESQKLSAEAGFAGVRAGAASDVKETLERKYSASDGNVTEIIHACNAAAGLVISTSSAATPPASPSADLPSQGTSELAEKLPVDLRGSCGETANCAARCEGGDADSCGIAAARDYVGAGAVADEARALSLAERGCDARARNACVLAGHLYEARTGKAGPDVDKAQNCYRRAGDLPKSIELEGTWRMMAPDNVKTIRFRPTSGGVEGYEEGDDKPGLQFRRADSRSWIGRHVWKGKDGPYWGAADQTNVRALGPHLMKVYLEDSVYKGGWLYFRVR